MGEDIKTSTKWIIAISWIVLLFVGIVVFQNLSRESAEEKAETDRQYYLEMAREYEIKAAAEYERFESYEATARSIWSEYMSSDQRVDYEMAKKASSVAWDRYYEYSKLAEQYRNWAQRE